jgi:hypothetical protein
MKSIEELLHQMLRDDRHALPTWPDAATRIRAGITVRRRQHRRRAVLVVVGILALLVVTVPAVARQLSYPPANPTPTVPAPGEVIPWLDRPAALPPQALDPPLGVLPGGLKARIDAPDIVKAGSDVWYVVTLINQSGSSIAFDPCPVYAENLDFTEHTYLLNCVFAAIPAGSWIRLMMRVSVPATAPHGSTTLAWWVRVASGQTAAADQSIDIE